MKLPSLADWPVTVAEARALQQALAPAVERRNRLPQHGHRINLSTAVDFVLRCAPRYRLPETTRQAHRLASGEPGGQNR